MCSCTFRTTVSTDPVCNIFIVKQYDVKNCISMNQKGTKDHAKSIQKHKSSITVPVSSRVKRRVKGSKNLKN